MAYQPHTLVTIGGTLQEVSADDEIWQIGIRGFAPGGVPVSSSKLNDLALYVLRGPTGAGGGMEGIWSATTGKIATTAKLAWCKAANIGGDGRYTAEPGKAQITPLAGGTVAQAPSFCCVALSFTTGKTLGKAVRGRVYPPNYGATRDPGAAVAAGTVTNLKDWAISLLQAFDTTGASDPGVVWNPYVISQSGVSNLITGVRVGNVYDTQRRRKDKVAETYTSGAFTP